MIEATRNWFKRNRTNLAIGAGVVGSVYLAGQWALGKVTEARQRMSDDKIAKENLRRRFAQNQEDCTYTVLALLPTCYENIIRALPVEDITAELQARKTEKIARSTQASQAGSEIAPSDIGTEEGSQGTGSFIHASQAINGSDGASEVERRVVTGKSKILLWEELKIQSITRSLTLLYTLPLLTLLTRIQLNLLGRRTYLSSVVSLASPGPNPMNPTDPTSSSSLPRDPNNTTSTPPDFAHPSTPITLENHDDDRTSKDYYNADFDTNRKYLTFSWWLLHKGCQQMREIIEASVREVFGPWNPRDAVPFERLADLVLEVRKRVEGRDERERSERAWLGYLLPPREEEEALLRESGMLGSSSSSSSAAEPPAASSAAHSQRLPEQQAREAAAAGAGAAGGGAGNNRTEEEAITPSLRRLLDETSDLIDSPTFTHVLTLLLDAAFSHLIDVKVAREAYKIPPQSQLQGSAATSAFGGGSDTRVQDVTDSAFEGMPTARLANILPVFTKQAAAIGRGGDEAIGAVGQLSQGLGGLGGGVLGDDGGIFGDGGDGDGEEGASGVRGANEYLAAVEGVRDLEAFAAVVYSSNFEFEGVGEEGEGELGGEGGGGGLGTRDVEASLVEVGKDIEGKLESAWEKARGR